ncbi:MAG: helix-turn-helix domain-containing protein [Acidimicrobiales bacterium]
MSSSTGTLSPRTLSSRQADTVNRLVEATVEEVRESGFGGLTVRNVAARAGVAPATAYTYFASKEHLVGEVFWRRLQSMGPGRLDGRLSVANRAGATLREVAMLVADEPELSAACTTALLVNDPEVKQLRDRIGADIHQRLVVALGEDDPTIIGALELAYSGAMLQTGTGHLSYDELADRLAGAAELILGGRS